MTKNRQFRLGAAPKRDRWILLGALLTCGCLSGWANLAPAQTDNKTAAATDSDQRPPPTDQPTEVQLGMYLLDVVEINDSEQTITIDLGVSMRWTDPRLVDKAGQIIPMEDVWVPNLQLMSNNDIRLTKPKVVQVSQGGQAEYLQRYIGTMWHSSDLSRFPFDNQTYCIQMLAPLYTAKDLKLVEDPERTGQADGWSLPGWDYSPGGWESDPFYFGPAREDFAGAAYVFTAHRKRGFYFWKVILPISLVILMSGAVFWIDPSNSSSQISVAYTAILALVAYRFVIGNMVPAVSYMTCLDRFMLGASILVVCVLIEAIWTGRLVARGQLERSVRVDYWSRWLFLAAYILIVLISFVF